MIWIQLTPTYRWSTQQLTSPNLSSETKYNCGCVFSLLSIFIFLCFCFFQPSWDAAAAWVTWTISLLKLNLWREVSNLLESTIYVLVAKTKSLQSGPSSECSNITTEKLQQKKCTLFQYHPFFRDISSMEILSLLWTLLSVKKNA